MIDVKLTLSIFVALAMKELLVATIVEYQHSKNRNSIERAVALFKLMQKEEKDEDTSDNPLH